MEFFNEFGLKVKTYDSTDLLYRTITCPVECVPSNSRMLDLPPKPLRGTLRTGGQVHSTMLPDDDDPHWTINSANEVIGWQSHFILREDWGTPDIFYKSSNRLQKHMQHPHRYVNVSTGLADRGRSVSTIKLEEPYRFQRQSRYRSSSRAHNQG